MLSERSKQIRRDTISLSKANGGYHYGGSFSCVEILVSLFDETMTEDDKFILSKGHACWPYYVLLRERGFKPKLEGHPKRDDRNGIHCTTGSLGHGFPVGIGMALGRKMQSLKGHVYVLVGDGECQEGTTWESLMLAARLGLNNLAVIVDWNGLQGSGDTNQILPLPDIGKVAANLGWHVSSIDGHDVEAITAALTAPMIKPKFIIAKTIKGKGVSFMEGEPEWHAKWPSPEQEAAMFEELS